MDQPGGGLRPDANKFEDLARKFIELKGTTPSKEWQGFARLLIYAVDESTHQMSRWRYKAWRPRPKRTWK